MSILLKFLIKDEREKIDGTVSGLTQGGVGAWRQSRGRAEGRRGGCTGHAGFGAGGGIHIYITAGPLEGAGCRGYPRANDFT